MIISGENFTAGSMLRVDGQVSDNAIVNGNSITAKRVPLTAETHELRVENSGGVISDPFSLTVR